MLQKVRQVSREYREKEGYERVREGGYTRNIVELSSLSVHAHLHYY